MKMHSLLSTALALLIFAPFSHGATFTVTNTNNAGAGSLRRAVSDANAAAGADIIEFALGAGTRTITLTTGEIVIDPPSDQAVRISGNNASRVFRIDGSGGGTVTLRDLRKTKGQTRARPLLLKSKPNCLPTTD